MSWLDDEADKHRQTTDSENYQEEVIRRSNYWALIVDSLRTEVEAINSHSHWKPLVGPFPLKLVRASNVEEWQVVMSGKESLRIAIQNKYDHVLVGREFSNAAHYKEFPKREKLRIATSGEAVVLITDGNEKLIVPEDVAQYLMRGVLASLKASAPSLPSKLSVVN